MQPSDRYRDDISETLLNSAYKIDEDPEILFLLGNMLFPQIWFRRLLIVDNKSNILVNNILDVEEHLSMTVFVAIIILYTQYNPYNMHTIMHYNDIIMGTMAYQITSLNIVYSTVYSGADQTKHQSFVSLALCGEFTGTGEFPAQIASNAENVPINGVIIHIFVLTGYVIISLWILISLLFYLSITFRFALLALMQSHACLCANKILLNFMDTIDRYKHNNAPAVCIFKIILYLDMLSMYGIRSKFKTCKISLFNLEEF